MGAAKHPNKVKLIIGLLSNDPGILPEVAGRLVKNFGRIDFESALIDFGHTQYYAEEFGEGLKRKFLGFEHLVDPETAYAIKVKTNRLEERFSRNGKRRVNIDPGYLSLSKLILFSTKDYSHRIYLGKGIFAEVTLFYKNNSYNPLPWTYPDYRTTEYLDIFGRMRMLYKERVNSGGLG